MDKPALYTDDPGMVVEVWWGWPTNVLYEHDIGEYEIELPDEVFTQRLRTFADTFQGLLFGEFPNLSKWRMENTGWDSDWAQFSPRAICSDENWIYEPFFDVMTRIEDAAARTAIDQHPWDYEAEYADMMTEAEEEQMADHQREQNILSRD